jgi:hypothetical protein
VVFNLIPDAEREKYLDEMQRLAEKRTNGILVCSRGTKTYQIYIDDGGIIQIY